MSVTLTLDDEIDISRGDVLAGRADVEVGQRFEADVVWMDERPLDPARVYLLKHTTRTVTAEVDPALVLNQIGTVDGHDGAAAGVRPLRRQPRHRQLHPDRSGDEFTAGAGMIAESVRERSGDGAARPSAAERLARLARGAASDAEATEAVRKALEELLT